MVVEATHCAVIPIDVTETEKALLHDTYKKYRHCQNTASEHCWNKYDYDECVTSKRQAEQALYSDLREATGGLHANLVQKAIKDATSAVDSAVERWKNRQRCSKPEWTSEHSWSMAYDKRAATYSRYKASFATVNGRIECEYELPADLDGTPYTEYVLDRRWSFSTSRLIYREDDGFYLHAVMKREFPDSPFDIDHVREEWGYKTHNENYIQVLGVDLNVNGYTAVTSAGGFYGNADYLNHQRNQYERVRSGLQQTGTRSAHQTIQSLRGREARWFDEYAHVVANGVVYDALRTQCTHVAVEKLTYIRDNISNDKEYQQWMFDRVIEYVRYKLVPFGIDIVEVDSKNTSKGCSNMECGHVSQANRRGDAFECVTCGLSLHADYNAARKVGLRFFEEHDQSGRTCQAGRAISQLALKSGTLSPDGDFESVDWVSTDKPTTSVVGS